MKKFLKENAFKLCVSFYSLLVALMWLAMRINYAGISKALGADKFPLSETISPTKFDSFIVMYLPYIFCALFFLLFIGSVINVLVNKTKKWPTITLLVLNIIFTAVIVVVYVLGSADYAFAILPKFFKSLVISLLIILFAFILFFNIEGPKTRVLATKSAIMLIVITTTIVLGYNLRSNRFTYDSVVYAVEDEYQIVFSTSDNSIAWVEVGDKTYYDTYAGSLKSTELVHKISVKQSDLDSARKYTIYAQQVLYRGPFGGNLGKTISIEHNFKPIDTEEIKYYCLSDVHGNTKGAVNAFNNANKDNNIDFLVIGGDMCSDVEGEYWANYTNLICSKTTKGEIPVVYARGNHEVKGTYAEDLYKYVGSKDENFYYYFTLASGKIFGLVLDMAEDHEEGTDEESYGEWWEYYSTDKAYLYRDEQTKFLQSFNASDLATNSYNMVVCHIPLTYVNYRGDHTTWKDAWTTELNRLTYIDAVLSGHQHELTPFIPDSIDVSETNKNNTLMFKMNENFYDDPGTFYSTGTKARLTNYEYYSFMIGRNSNEQNSECSAPSKGEYSGLLMSIVSTTQKATWTNSNGENVKVCSMFKLKTGFTNETLETWTNTLVR